MEANPMKNDARRGEVRRRLGEDPACLLCQCQTPVCLTKVNATLLERHHVVGRKVDDDLTATVCLNCHRPLQAGLKDLGLEDRRPGSALEAAALSHLGLEDFLENLADSVGRRGRELLELMDRLDQEMPEWRQMTRRR